MLSLWLALVSEQAAIDYAKQMNDPVKLAGAEAGKCPAMQKVAEEAGNPITQMN